MKNLFTKFLLLIFLLFCLTLDVNTSIVKAEEIIEEVQPTNDIPFSTIQTE